MGRSSQPQPVVVQPPAPQIIERPTQNLNPQTVQETSRQLAQSQLEFNPQLAAQSARLYQQYAPQTAQTQADIQRQLAPGLAQSEFDIASQFTPLYRALYEQTFPTQTQGLETLAQQAAQRLESPQSLTPEQQALQDQSRGRAREDLSRSIRESANVGGTLFGGRRQAREDEAQRQLEAQFSEQDINRQLAQRQQALQELIAAQQVVFPQIQQPGVPSGAAPAFQSVTPSAESLLQAMLAQTQGAVINPAVVGFGPSRLSQIGQIAGGLGTAAAAL